MDRRRRATLFALFVASGFCGLLYQVVWLRLAFAAFGIITPVVSVVVSVFMLGLALGSIGAGQAAAAFTQRTGRSALYLYALAELVIGIGAFAVPPLLHLGEAALGGLGETRSFAYLSLSALAIALALLPWCIAMGATYPLVMAYVREEPDADPRSFSHLYLANVIGASLGAFCALLLVELLGFQRTLWIAGAANALVALRAWALARASRSHTTAPPSTATHPEPGAARASIPWARTILFATGFAALAMEVVWTRTFTPVLGTQVYAFAALLVVYLIATWVGSLVYRRDLARSRVRPMGWLLAGAAIAALLPVLLNDPRYVPAGLDGAFFALASIVPFCAILGYLTPRLVDEHARGDPRAAGRAYAINAGGCILGPLAASYILLPAMGARLSLALLTLPLAILAIAWRGSLPRAARIATASAFTCAMAIAVLVNVSHENPCQWISGQCEVRRDYTATVVSEGHGRGMRLLVNGVGITSPTPITKFMAHLPLALHETPPRTALVICFGMGTTYRSLLSWGVETTAVELVPSVWDAFPYYHADARRVMADPRGQVVIDDGRRFLGRTRERYDAIVVDPPPPVEAAGSSLLYSREFHEAVRDHLAPGGVFQTWYPGSDDNVGPIAMSLGAVFPHVKVYRSVAGWGFHFLASMEPLREIDAYEAVRRMPPAARADLAEWQVYGVREDFATVFARPVPLQALESTRAVMLTDDRPVNEYYLLRKAALGGS